MDGRCTCTYSDANTHCDPNAYSNPKSDAYTVSHTNAKRESDTYSDTYAESFTNVRSSSAKYCCVVFGGEQRQ